MNRLADGMSRSGASLSLKRRLLATGCAPTGLTEQATRRRGATEFLPAPFAQRYTNMGGLDRARLEAEIANCRSFTDDGWCDHWDAIAARRLERAAIALEPIDPAAPAAPRADDPDVSSLTGVVAPYATLLADHSLQPPAEAVSQHEGEHAATVVAVVRAVLAAITYLQASAFPGGTPRRMAAYHRSRRLFDGLADAFAAGLPTIVERVSIQTATEVVHAYRCLPRKDEPCPMVVVTNGLEGTVQELLVPLLRYPAIGLGVLVMEMPGSYAPAQRMSTQSEGVYRTVIDIVAADPRVDAARIGMVGVSFGGYWAARMAAVDPRLACTVAGGAPTHRSFRPKLGMPEIIIEALSHVTGATTPGRSAQKPLRALPARPLRRHRQAAARHQRRRGHAAQHPGLDRPRAQRRQR